MLFHIYLNQNIIYYVQFYEMLQLQIKHEKPILKKWEKSNTDAIQTQVPNHLIIVCVELRASCNDLAYIWPIVGGDFDLTYKLDSFNMWLHSLNICWLEGVEMHLQEKSQCELPCYSFAELHEKGLRLNCMRLSCRCVLGFTCIAAALFPHSM